MAVSFIKGHDGSLTLVLGSKPYVVHQSDSCYEQVKKALVAQDEKLLLRLLDKPKVINSYTKGKVEVKDGVVFFAGQLVHNTVTNRILQFVAEGLPFAPLVKFLENLMENPSMRSREELYDFLEHKGLPINEKGEFLAYKAVREDYMDKYSNTINNSVGRVVEMTRPKVDDCRQRECSFGLHVGCLDYVSQYGNGSTDKIVIVAVNPRDAVSVPLDYGAQKLRVCRYEVVADFLGELTSSSLYHDHSTPVTGNYNDWMGDFDDDFDEDLDDDTDTDEFVDDDDNWEGHNVKSTPVKTPTSSCCSGHKNCNYHNVRDANGRFTEK